MTLEIAGSQLWQAKLLDGELVGSRETKVVMRNTSSSVPVKDPTVSGRDYYESLYQKQVDAEAEWLRRGAIEKANSIERLLNNHGIHPTTLMELGCGTGAVIRECQTRGLAQRYIAADYSTDALQYLQDSTTNIETICTDITIPGTLPRQVDVVIVSHVLEHLEAPAVFLQALRHIEFSYLIAEVPLEDLYAGRLKSWIWDRTRNISGHVQFFNAPSFRRLLAGNGLSVIAERTYVPILDRDTIKFVSEKNSANRLQRMRMTITNYYLPSLLESLWAKFYYAHHAVLCNKSA
ncbi:MAG: class I SAM-dependent methyltransferase [Nitrospira sp.]|nr:class I SAM-dependent methyltransferase [Nitrospira sp.]